MNSLWTLLNYKVLEASSVTLYEYVILLASLEAVFYPKKYNCSLCRTQYGHSERLIKKAERNRRASGCFDYTTKKYRVENIIYKSCLGNYQTNINFFLESFAKYEQGMLPFNGTISEQPNKVIEIFNIIESRRHEFREKQK